MATFTQTLTNRVNLFGQGPSTKWGQVNSTVTMVWGTSTWGEGESLPLKIYKYIIDDTLTLSENVARLQTTKFITNTLPVIADMTNETLRDGSQDWQYVFTSNQTNAENRNLPSWSSQTTGSPTWASGTSGAASWASI